MCCTKHVVVLVLVAFPKEQCQNRAHVASARFLYNGASEKINSYREKKKVNGRRACFLNILILTDITRQTFTQNHGDMNQM